MKMKEVSKRAVALAAATIIGIGTMAVHLYRRKLPIMPAFVHL